MPIRQTTPQAVIDRTIREHTERQMQALINNLAYIGNEVVNQARRSTGYTDRTGNLRSSVGYVLVSNGKVVSKSGFGQVLNGKDGSDKGDDFAQELARRFGYPKTVVLIVVAGMNYARYVANTGRDILDSAELLADKLVPTMLHKLGLK